MFHELEEFRDEELIAVCGAGDDAFQPPEDIYATLHMAYWRWP